MWHVIHVKQIIDDRFGKTNDHYAGQKKKRVITTKFTWEKNMFIVNIGGIARPFVKQYQGWQKLRCKHKIVDYPVIIHNA